MTKVVRESKVRCYVSIILVVTKYKIHNILITQYTVSVYRLQHNITLMQVKLVITVTIYEHARDTTWM